MLDFELAELYGYETKSFNQQVRRNVDKFPEDFRFQITREELDNLVRSQKVTSRNNVFKGQSGGSRYLPWCYTESGVYMLMTILKSDVAVAQSIAPYVVDGQIIILNPGRTCGALVFKQTLIDAGCKARFYLAEAQTLVYACRIVQNGTVNIIGVKDENS